MRTWLPLCFILVSCYCIFNVESKRKSQGKLNYEINWAGGIGLCDDVEQDLLNLDDLVIEKDSATGTVLGGAFDITNEIVNGTKATIYVNKDTDQGVVLVTVMQIQNICDHVPEEDRPWTAVFDAMNLDPRDCPLPIKNFELESIKLNLSSMDSLLNRDNVGEYAVRIELSLDEDGGDSDDSNGNQGDGAGNQDENVIGCFKLGMSIDEVREKE